MNILAIDLGAGSGRIIRGTIESSELTLTEIYRFPNIPERSGESIHWDITNIWTGVVEGLRMIENEPIDSISVDSWGVDYVLLDSAGQILEPTFHYRDPRTKVAAQSFLRKVPWKRVFDETGIQFMPINTLFQLASESPARLKNAHQLLGIADAFNRWLGGEPCIEESLAGTVLLFNPVTRDWSGVLVKELGLPDGLLPKVVPAGTIVGNINPQLKTDMLANAKIIATCSHDTGAAVAAVPAQGTKWAYLSSGTWSLMGVERDKPVINDVARELNFTNEIGYGGAIPFFKNISGLWLLQECRRAWGPYDYAELTALATNEVSFRSIINPADPRFLAPANMLDEIAAFCGETEQAIPETPAQYTRCIFESLALLYRRTLKEIEQLTGDKIEVLHVVGGGSKNKLMNQFTADACQVEVP